MLRRRITAVSVCQLVKGILSGYGLDHGARGLADLDALGRA